MKLIVWILLIEPLAIFMSVRLFIFNVTLWCQEIHQLAAGLSHCFSRETSYSCKSKRSPIHWSDTVPLAIPCIPLWHKWYAHIPLTHCCYIVNVLMSIIVHRPSNMKINHKIMSFIMTEYVYIVVYVCGSSVCTIHWTIHPVIKVPWE